MGLFDAMNTATTGVNVSQTWLDAISDNISNMNDVTSTSNPAFQARYVEAGAIPGSGATQPGTSAATDASLGGGTQVTGIALGPAAGTLAYDPSNPLADSKGMVRTPSVDLASQMTDMLMAQQGYQANIATIKQAEQAYQAALGLKS